MKRRRMDDLDMKVLNNHRRDLRRDLHEDLHEDVIFYHILTRLPVKVLLQLRLVCKSWRRFLSSNNPSFIDRQLSRSQYGLGGIKLLILGRQRQSRCLLLINLEEGKDGRVNELLPIPNEEFNDFSISENIKGLVCLHQIVGTRSCTSIRNLSTREVMELPLAPDITTNDDDMTMTRMHMSHHFGFDPSSKQFKVLNIQFASYNCRGTAYGVAFWIFTLGCDSWRQIYPVLPFNVVGYNEPSPWLFLLKNCVCLNGALHWLFKAKKVIVVFNIKKEEFHAIPLPKISMLPDAERVVLLQVDGHLVVLSLRDDVLNHGMLDMEIWTLEDYQNKVWMKYTVTIPFQDWRKWHDRPVFVVPADKDLQLENGSQSHSHLGVLCYVAKQRSLMRVQIPELSNLGISHIYNSISNSETIHNLLF